MQTPLPYLFHYNVPFTNDRMGKMDMYLQIKATCLYLTEGINPVISFHFNDVPSLYMERIKDMRLCVREIEKLVYDHFKEEVGKMNFLTPIIN